MKAITVEPHNPGTACLEDFAEPDARDGSVLVEAIAVGVCGTDVEIVGGKYGWAPQGKKRLVLGHESLGRVIDPGPSGALHRGDLVVGIVRRPDPVPCPNCAVGEWDMCRHWYRAGQVLAKADPAWLARLVTRREVPAQFERALQRQPDDIKVVIQFAEG
jgi:threonine dehydrogenase-like Zn-dependent dehydrogenase